MLETSLFVFTYYMQPFYYNTDTPLGEPIALSRLLPESDPWCRGGTFNPKALRSIERSIPWIGNRVNFRIVGEQKCELIRLDFPEE